MPTGIPDPPPAWRNEYPALAAEATLGERELPAALDTVRAFWARTSQLEQPSDRDNKRHERDDEQRTARRDRQVRPRHHA